MAMTSRKYNFRAMMTLQPPGVGAMGTFRPMKVLIFLIFVSIMTLISITLTPVKEMLAEVSHNNFRGSRNAILLNLLREFPSQKDAPFKQYQLDVSRSNRIPLDRVIPDTRHPECADITTYDISGMDVSVIMPFHDESWSMLLRALHSVVDRTPPNVLREIILIDDTSHYSYLGEPLLSYLSVLSPKIRLFRNLRREGLIRSRVRAAKVARGQVLVFLDAHVEVNKGWVEPLLAHIREKGGRVLAVPHIDNISPEDIAYTPWSQEVHGSFSWDLEYVWKFIPDRLHHVRRAWLDPVPTPTTIGCAMAIDREYFFHQGSFDEGMYIWGGENLEISFRMWMCGGEVNIVPCSRVGHVFRKLLPYFFPFSYGGNETRYKNYQRLADVWMGEYKYYYYAASHLHLTYTSEESSSLQARLRLKSRLQCRDFSWYLTEVVPEMGLPPKDNVTFFGQIGNARGGNSCVTRINGSLPLRYVPLTTCGHHYADQNFYLSQGGYLQTTDNLCISANKTMKYLQLLPCDLQDDDILRVFSFDVSPRPTLTPVAGLVKNAKVGRITLMYRNRMLCMEQVTLTAQVQVLAMNMCNDDEKNFQLWSFSYQFDFSHVEKVKRMVGSLPSKISV